MAVNYRPVHLLTYYRETFGFREGMFPQTELVEKRTLSLPLYPLTSENDVTTVILAEQQAALFPRPRL